MKLLSSISYYDSPHTHSLPVTLVLFRCYCCKRHSLSQRMLQFHELRKQAKLKRLAKAFVQYKQHMDL